MTIAAVARWAFTCVLLIAAAPCMLGSCHAPAAKPVMRPPQTPELLTTTLERPISVHFQLFLPSGYGVGPAKHWPLILFLHGAGERGDDIERVKVHGPPKLAEKIADFPFIVISPQCPSSESWNNDVLNALLDHALATWAVDKQRVYLTGLSMGGFGSWSLALENPERFAAVVPICGGGTPIAAHMYGDSAKGNALKSLPFWAFHGALDTTVDPSESARMVESLRAIGCDVKYTIYPGVGHDSWVKAYDDPELYAWLLSHARKD